MQHRYILPSLVLALGLVVACDQQPASSPLLGLRMGMDEPRGTLTVKVGDFLGQLKQRRHTLGVDDGVDHVVVTVVTAEDEASRTLDGDALLEAEPVATFDELPAGPVTVTTEAFDEADEPTGVATGAVTVVAGDRTEVALPQTESEGSLMIRATVVDGPVFRRAAPH